MNVERLPNSIGGMMLVSWNLVADLEAVLLGEVFADDGAAPIVMKSLHLVRRHPISGYIGK